MSLSWRHWLIIGTTSFTIGSSIAIAERFLAKGIDSLLPDSRRVTRFSRPSSITLLSTNGKVIQKLGPATREKVEKGKIPPLIKQAFIAAEDRRFFEHKGVDLWGISRAVITNLRQRSVQEGASTITQQLARTVFLNQERTISRKLKEAALAFKLERDLSKEEILEQYLNNVYLGSGAYGIADAAWVYFSKTPNLLTLEEIALIAGLAPAPSFFSPLVNPELAINRRQIVLDKMRNEGFISSKDLNNSSKKPLHLKPATPKYSKSIAPFFSSWVAQKLPLLLTAEQIEVGGLTILTSLNLDWQKKAQEILLKKNPRSMEGAIVSIEPNTGFVRVLLGGKNFETNEYNRATQASRSPGSTFKIFPYLAALESGIKPEDLFIDMPQCWNGYCPKNFGNKYMGEVSLSDAFKNSLNTVAIQILDKVGFEKVISTANKLGVGNSQKLGRYYPLAIGAYEQTLLDMTAAYAGVANRGVYMKPTPFEEIRGPGNVILWSKELNANKGTKAIQPDTADTMNWMLEQAVRSGTGVAASLKDRPVAGKTGTSEGGRDLWFIGSIPQLTTGIWFGFDNNQVTNMGSGESALAWKQYMLGIKDDFQPLGFRKGIL